MKYYPLANLVHDEVEKRFIIVMGGRYQGKIFWFEQHAKRLLLKSLLRELKQIIRRKEDER